MEQPWHWPSKLVLVTGLCSRWAPGISPRRCAAELLHRRKGERNVSRDSITRPARQISNSSRKPVNLNIESTYSQISNPLPRPNAWNVCRNAHVGTCGAPTLNGTRG